MAYQKDTVIAMERPPENGGRTLDNADPAVGKQCVVCDAVFVGGNVVMSLLGGPGSDPGEQAKAMTQTYYNAVGLLAHHTCVRGY